MRYKKITTGEKLRGKKAPVCSQKIQNQVQSVLSLTRKSCQRKPKKVLSVFDKIETLVNASSR